MPDPTLRAADADRATVAAALGQHLSDGRLTVEEYDERLTKAYAARTYGELEELFRDLPRPAPSAPPVARPTPAGGASAPARCSGRDRNHLRASWTGWVTTSLIVTAIWLAAGISGGFHAFWPIWVIGPWGAALLARTLTGQPPRGRERDRRRR